VHTLNYHMRNEGPDSCVSRASRALEIHCDGGSEMAPLVTEHTSKSIKQQ